VRRLLIALPLVALLVFAPAARAGGWATVGLSSTPAGVGPGQPWVVDMTILQHGVTPLEDVKPAVLIRLGNETHTFAAEPTGKPGVYRASVVFPTKGTWEYQVDDGFISATPHTFPPVEIGRATAQAPAPATTTTSDGGGVPGWLAIPGIALLLASVVLLLVDRRRMSHHQPQAA
jgi:hypothetical protein